MLASDKESEALEQNYIQGCAVSTLILRGFTQESVWEAVKENDFTILRLAEDE